jgi:hypothetical protein
LSRPLHDPVYITPRFLLFGAHGSLWEQINNKGVKTMTKEERGRRLDFIGKLYPGFYLAPPVYHNMTDKQLEEAWRLALRVKIARRELEYFAESTAGSEGCTFSAPRSGKRPV